MTVVIAAFRPEHGPAFDALNRAWLTAHGLLEPADEPHLTDPVGEIIAPGGQIFVALMGDTVVGTCAILPHDDPGALELVKLAVAPEVRGRGIGRRLVDACLAFAMSSGARHVVLLSSTRLGAALRLYEQVGFRYKPVPPTSPYATADVYMELEMGPEIPVGS